MNHIALKVIFRSVGINLLSVWLFAAKCLQIAMANPHIDNNCPTMIFLPFKHEWRQPFFLKRGFYWDDLDTEGILLPNTPPLWRVKFHSPPTVPFDVVHLTRALYDVLNCTYTDRLWFYSYDCIVKMRRLPCCLSRVVGLRKIYNVFVIPWIAKQLFQNAMT